MDFLKKIFLNLALIQNQVDRIDYLSAYFLGRPYINNPQGEGDHGDIDQAPLYRFDGFDCVTYINNILALSRSFDVPSFLTQLLQINYYQGIPKFENRFHFMSVDWNSQNQKNKITKDVTENFVDANKNKMVLFAEGEIDKPGWFLKRAENEGIERAEKLNNYARQCHIEFARLPYLPLVKLFDSDKNPEQVIFNQIPHAAVVEIVRPNWQLKEKIGANLHVSHIGFAIRKNNQVYFRHASSEQKKVVEVLLVDYLKDYLGSSTVKGINVQIICSSPVD